ncbi:sigma factor, ECF-like family protein [Oceanococcus atlanticus]|uniref:Sigma factor, ECF-like family protein n=1 Tax=Oceanococcus atlanticus TaxID=1317117 RepID=A0A1Y1SHG6_9GAMM|nr:ECF-type sigma factor [Oceanococcus atlanticus]ORE89096.1 sigma factor, ECF-like family protein [Oceanococcus atlanticus]
MEQQHNAGDLTRQGAGALYQALYQELKTRAHRERRKLVAGQTFVTTALVNEAFFKLAAGNQDYASRAHFLNTAAAAMRQVLVDSARATLAEKRGSGQKPLSLDDSGLGLMPADPSEGADFLLELNQHLEQLAALSSRLAKVVECRFFSGYTDAETAEALDVTERTVRRDWLKAKAWLYDAMS